MWEHKSLMTTSEQWNMKLKKEITVGKMRRRGRHMIDNDKEDKRESGHNSPGSHQRWGNKPIMHKLMMTGLLIAYGP